MGEINCFHCTASEYPQVTNAIQKALDIVNIKSFNSKRNKENNVFLFSENRNCFTDKIRG